MFKNKFITILMLALLSIVLTFSTVYSQTTSHWGRVFKNVITGALQTGLDVDLYTYNGAKVYDLTEDVTPGGRVGYYFHDNVATGQYDIYVGGVKKYSGIWIGSNKLTVIQSKFNDSGEISTGGIQDGAVNEDKLASAAVSTIKIEDLAVTAAKIATNAVTETKISNNAVTENKISTNSINAGHLKDNIITEDNIVDMAVSTSKIEDGAVTAAKLAPTSVRLSHMSPSSVAYGNLTQGLIDIINSAGGGSIVNNPDDSTTYTTALSKIAVRGEYIRAYMDTAQTNSYKALFGDAAGTGLDAVGVKAHLTKRNILPITDYGADNTGVSDTYDAWVATLAAADSGDIIEVPDGTFKLTQKVTINKSVTVRGTGHIREVNAGTTDLFEIAVSNVSFEGANGGYLTIEGQKPSNWATNVHIFLLNPNGTLRNLVFKNLYIYNKAIVLRRVAAVSNPSSNTEHVHFKDSILDSIRTGIAFTGTDTDTFKNIYHTYDNLFIRSLQGTASRCIGNSNNFNVSITNSTLIGSGIDIELYTTNGYFIEILTHIDSIGYNFNQYIAGNRISTAASGGSEIIGNTFDGSLLPPGRTFQAGFITVIEPLGSSRVIGNTVINTPSGIGGVALLQPSVIVQGNRFVNMDEGSYGAVWYSAKYDATAGFAYNRKHRIHTIIDGNTFHFVKAGIREVTNNSSAALFAKGYIITNNIFRNITGQPIFIRWSKFFFIDNNYIERPARNFLAVDGQSAILVEQSNNIFIRNNTIRNGHATKGAAYGIHLATSADTSYVSGNVVDGILTNAYLLNAGSNVNFTMNNRANGVTQLSTSPGQLTFWGAQIGVTTSPIYLNQAKTLGIFWGTGSPEGAVIAIVGSTYHNTSGGANTTLYVKESGTGNTGWVAK